MSTLGMSERHRVIAFSPTRVAQATTDTALVLSEKRTFLHAGSTDTSVTRLGVCEVNAEAEETIDHPNVFGEIGGEAEETGEPHAYRHLPGGINPLKTKCVCFIYGLSAYRAVNILHVGYKN
jgi:hypothetical protein